MKVPIHEPVLTVELWIEWKDKSGYCKKGFQSVQDLAEFLKDNPELGDRVGYKKKK